MQVQQLMSEPVQVCSTTDTLSDAARLMWDNDCGAVPIVDEKGRVVSMLTDRDICMAAYTQGRPLTEIGVCAAMSHRLVVCHPEDSLDRAEELMSSHQIRRLPVVDPEGLAVGILSLNDLTRAAAHAPVKGQAPSNGVRQVSTLRTLAAVCATRSLATGPKLA